MQVLTLRGPAVSKVLETYAATLAELRSYVPDLLLTGGAVRDVYFGRPVKDLDFMTCDAQAARILAEFYNDAIYPVLSEKDEKYEATRETLLKAYENESKSINVLWVSDFNAHISLFPDSISQVWTDGEEVYASVGFNDTAANRVVQCTDRMAQERVQRIKAKYHDFVFQRVDIFGGVETL
ncbi:hypothetical protein PQR71_29165 [Paraburkholderia fungorum]|uniref:hypothetical protein n=1 Tax=Paraburkholderia fungorum TaxID=134537 RepID=UPI0038BDEBB1